MQLLQQFLYCELWTFLSITIISFTVPQLVCDGRITVRHSPASFDKIVGVLIFLITALIADMGKFSQVADFLCSSPCIIKINTNLPSFILMFSSLVHCAEWLNEPPCYTVFIP